MRQVLVEALKPTTLVILSCPPSATLPAFLLGVLLIVVAVHLPLFFFFLPYVGRQTWCVCRYAHTVAPLFRVPISCNTTLSRVEIILSAHHIVEGGNFFYVLSAPHPVEGGDYLIRLPV